MQYRRRAVQYWLGGRHFLASRYRNQAYSILLLRPLCTDAPCPPQIKRSRSTGGNIVHVSRARTRYNSSRLSLIRRSDIWFWSPEYSLSMFLTAKHFIALLAVRSIFAGFLWGGYLHGWLPTTTSLILDSAFTMIPKVTDRLL